MAEDRAAHAAEPIGFGEHTRGLSGEYAHEQGWGLNQEERTKLPEEEEALKGGTDYDYGARDFGDTATDVSSVTPSPETEKFMEMQKEREGVRDVE